MGLVGALAAEGKVVGGATHHKPRQGLRARVSGLTLAFRESVVNRANPEGRERPVRTLDWARPAAWPWTSSDVRGVTTKAALQESGRGAAKGKCTASSVVASWQTLLPFATCRQEEGSGQSVVFSVQAGVGLAVRATHSAPHGFPLLCW